MRSIFPTPFGSALFWRLRVLAISIAFALGCVVDLVTGLFSASKRSGKSDQYW